MADFRIINRSSSTINEVNDRNSINLPDTVASDVSLNLGPEDISSYARQGDDLVIRLANGETIVIEDYFLQPGGIENRLFLGEEEPLINVQIPTDAAAGPISAPNYATVEASTRSAALIFEEASAVAVTSAGVMGSGALYGLAGLGLLAGLGGGGSSAEGVDPVTVTSASGAGFSGTGAPGNTVDIDTTGDGIPDLTTTVGEDGTWEIIPTGGVPDGSEVSITTSNPGGTQSDPVVLTVDGSAPIAPQVNPTDGTVISGTGEPGATVNIDTTGDGNPDLTTTVGEDGTWTVTSDPQLPNETTLVVTQVDPAGNPSAESVVTSDSEPPLAPVINPTNGTSLSGTGEPGAVLAIDTTGDGVPDIEVIVDSGGTWSTPLEPALTDGTEVSVSQTDSAGNSGPAAISVVDTVAPVAPTVEPTNGQVISGTGEPLATVNIDTTGDGNPNLTTTVGADGSWTVPADLADGTVIAVSQTDGVNESPAVNVTVDAGVPLPPTVEPSNGSEIFGTGEPGATINIDTTGDGVPDITTEVGTDGTWSASAAPALADGTAVAVTQSDAAGNESGSASIVIDGAVPAPPTINPSNGDEISGTGEPGVTVNIDLDGDGTPDLPPVIVAPDGTWSITPATPLDDGTEISATQTDEAGNEGPSQSVTVDSVEPEAPTIDGSSDGATVTGTGEPGATVEVDVDGDGTPDLTSVVGTDGTWSVTPSPALAEGTDISATQTDAAGNESDQTDGTIDTVAPDAPIVGIADTSEISGYAEPNSTVTVSAGGTDYTATADGSGIWSLSPVPTLAAGTELVVTAADDNGNVSPTETVNTGQNLVVNGTFDGDLGAAPIDNNPTGWTVSEPDSGNSIWNDNQILYFNRGGSAPTGLLEQTVSVETGIPVTFSFDYLQTSNDGAGDPQVLAELIDADGNVVFSQVATSNPESVSTSFVAESDSYTIRFTDQSTGNLSSIDGAIDNVSFVSEGGSDIAPPVVTEFAPGEISGTGQPGSTISIDVAGDGSEQGTTTVNADGTWTVTLATDVEPDENVSITQTDQASNESAPALIGAAETTTVLEYTGGDQTFDIRDDATSVNVQAWGASGSGRGVGGAGGYTEGTFDPNDLPSSILVVAGGGGEAADVDAQASGGYGGGGDGGAVDNNSTTTGGGGGGLSGIFDAASFAVATQADALLIAGGGAGDVYGGGSAPDFNAGAGGGGDGQSSGGGGGGGTSSAGGAAGTDVPAPNDFSGGTDVRPGNAGSALQGGDGANGFLFHSSGGGGGGYFGGGGGGIVGSLTNDDELESGGGGGSGFVSGLATGVVQTPGNFNDGANTSDENYVTGVGVHTDLNGTNGVSDDAGGNGQVVITTTQPRSGISASASAASFDEGEQLAALDDGAQPDEANDLVLDLGIVESAPNGLDQVDLTGSGDNTLTLELSDLLDLSSPSDTLLVLGDTGDTVNAAGFASTGETQTVENNVFDEYTAGAGTLLIDQDVTVIL